MKILFTGASSFTGYWFAKQLASAGHQVAAVFRRHPRDYPDDLRRYRALALADVCRPVCGISFGDDQFLKLIKESNWDLLCHHGAEATNYRSPDFNVTAAVENNTYRLPLVLDTLKESGAKGIVLTGSVFENDEGVGLRNQDAFSPYGLSKGLTWQIFRYHSQLRQLRLGKFVIPNPFGPYEEPRFTHYLFKNWFAGSTATVNTPNYVRDNIHVSLLAMAYVNFVERLPDGINRINPSGYVEQQGAFAHRIADEMTKRLSLRCGLELKEQTDFAEPRVRINTDILDVKTIGWSESAAWDELAEYYSKLMKRPE
jgi:UDP-glucose 4-epimerase